MVDKDADLDKLQRGPYLDIACCFTPNSKESGVTSFDRLGVSFASVMIHDHHRYALLISWSQIRQLRMGHFRQLLLRMRRADLVSSISLLFDSSSVESSGLSTLTRGFHSDVQTDHLHYLLMFVNSGKDKCPDKTWHSVHQNWLWTNKSSNESLSEGCCTQIVWCLYPHSVSHLASDITGSLNQFI